MKSYVFDTNTVSLILRREPQVITRFEQSINENVLIIACPVVWYEIQRGLQAKDAKSQFKRFEALFDIFDWQDFTFEDWQLAATLWVQRKKSGMPIADADLLIGAFSRNRDAILITNNEKDFVQLGVQIQNWVI